MERFFLKSLGRTVCSFAVASVLAVSAFTQCPLTEVAGGLILPLGIHSTNQRNLVVGETGAGAAGTGRISIVDPETGVRETLVAGLPSAINDVNEPSGPAGVWMEGRTLYVAIGIGDAIDAGPLPGTSIANPAGSSSPIFSSVLAIHFNAAMEKDISSVTLTPADEAALAAGEKVVKGKGRDKVTIRLVANFPDYIPNPLPFFEANVRGSNPFDLIVVGDYLYVTDGGRNLVWQVDLETGDYAPFAQFPPIPNPFFPMLGGPVVEAVPTGIEYSNGQLLVTLFRGFPFPNGLSSVQAIDIETGQQSPFITGLKSAIDVKATSDGYVVLRHASDPGLAAPGSLLFFADPEDAPVQAANCLVRPSSMTMIKDYPTIYITEVSSGRIVAYEPE
jgi:hypothetical protein